MVRFPFIGHFGKGKIIGTDIKAVVARGKGKVWDRDTRVFGVIKPFHTLTGEAVI